MPLFNQAFLESGQDIIACINGVDINGTTATGDWIRLRDYTRVGFLLLKYGAEDVDNTGLQFLQATSAAGANSKALSLPANRPIWYKTGVLTAQNTWTKTSLAADADGLAFGASVPSGFTRTIADVNTSALMLYTELLSTDLDVEPSDSTPFSWVTAFIGNNVDNACVVTVLAILQGGRFPQVVPLSAIS